MPYKRIVVAVLVSWCLTLVYSDSCCVAAECSELEKSVTLRVDGIIEPNLERTQTNSDHGVMSGDRFLAQIELRADSCQRNSDNEFTGEAHIDFQSDGLSFSTVETFRMGTLRISEQLTSVNPLLPSTVFNITDGFASLGIGYTSDTELVMGLLDVDLDPRLILSGSGGENELPEITNPFDGMGFRFRLDVIEGMTSVTSTTGGTTGPPPTGFFRDELQMFVLNDGKRTFNATQYTVYSVKSSSELSWADQHGFTGVRIENSEILFVPEAKSVSLTLLGVSMILAHLARQRASADRSARIN